MTVAETIPEEATTQLTQEDDPAESEVENFVKNYSNLTLEIRTQQKTSFLHYKDKMKFKKVVSFAQHYKMFRKIGEGNYGMVKVG